jgi:hypothetical protein
MADMQTRLVRVRPPLQELRIMQSLSYTRIRELPQQDPLLHALPHCGPDTLQSLMFVGEILTTSAAFAYLCARKTLLSITVTMVAVPSDVIDRALKQLERMDGCVPFANLRTLELETDWNGVALLAGSGLPSARELALRINDFDGTVRLGALAPCLANTSLRTLRITLVASAQLTGGDILAALQRLGYGNTSQLRLFSLRDTRYRPQPIDAFGDSHFTALAAALPLLKELNLEVDFGEGLTPAAFRIVGKHCRQLRTLRLSQRVDLHELSWRAEATSTTQLPLFPQLQYLRVRSPRQG